MKKIVFYTLLWAVALSSVSCRRAAEKIRRNIRVEAVEKFEIRGLTGVDLTLRVMNNTGLKLVLEKAIVDIYYGESCVGSILLYGGVEMPRRTTMSLSTRWQMRIADPLALYVLSKKVREGDLSQVSIAVNATGKGGPKVVNFSRERMPVSEFLNIFGVSPDILKNHIKK